MHSCIYAFILFLINLEYFSINLNPKKFSAPCLPKIMQNHAKSCKICKQHLHSLCCGLEGINHCSKANETYTVSWFFIYWLLNYLSTFRAADVQHRFIFFFEHVLVNFNFIQFFNVIKGSLEDSFYIEIIFWISFKLYRAAHFMNLYTNIFMYSIVPGDKHPPALFLNTADFEKRY